MNATFMFLMKTLKVCKTNNKAQIWVGRRGVTLIGAGEEQVVAGLPKEVTLK